TGTRSCPSRSTARSGEPSRSRTRTATRSPCTIVPEPQPLLFGATGAFGTHGLTHADAAATGERHFWINTVSLDHVEAAIEGAFTQADHGANKRLRQPRCGDEMIFYSPRTTLLGGAPVRQFTA